MATTHSIGGGWDNIAPDGAEAYIKDLLESGNAEGQSLVDLVNARFPDRTMVLRFSDANAFLYALGPGGGVGSDSITLQLPDGSPSLADDFRGVWTLQDYGPGTNNTGGAGALGEGVNFTIPEGLIVSQLGLLEDDILYRLSLLCVNVLQPLKEQYPGIVVIGGFRRANSGTGQHELGEAVDLQIRNQTPTLLYEVADYIQKHLNFDQLILNFTNIGDKQPWIHVSFSPTTLRGLVQTKDLADTFHDGLFLVDEPTGEAAAAAIRENDAVTLAIANELSKIQARQSRLTPQTAVEATDGAAGADATGGDSSAAAFDPPDSFDVVQQIFGTAQWDFTNDGDGTLSRGAFTEAVVAALHDLDANWGHIKKNPGQNQYNGHAVDAIAYKRDDLNAAVFVDIASTNPQWIVEPGKLNLWYF